MNPADELRTAAENLRSPASLGAQSPSTTVAALLRARAPLARWLVDSADFLDQVVGVHGYVTKAALNSTRHELAVARAILGSQP